MAKLTVFNVAEKEQAVLSKAMESFSIMRSERAILTLHNAFNTREALERILTTSAENFKAYFGGNPQNIVTENP